MPEFDPEELELPAWLDLFEMSADVNGATAAETKKSLLLSSIGIKTYSVIVKLCAPDLPSTKSFQDIVKLLKDHFVTAPSYHKALCEFLQRKKLKSETVKQYYAELKKYAKQCEFGGDFDRRLKEQLLVGIDQEVYFKVLLSDSFDFKAISSMDLLNKVTVLETAYVTENTEVNEIKKVGSQLEGSRSDGNHASGSAYPQALRSGREDSGNRECYRCGKRSHHPNNCKFKDYTCHFCEKKGHLSTVCRQRLNKESKNAKSAVTNKPNNNVKKSVNKIDEEEDVFDGTYDLYKIEEETTVGVNYVQPYVETFSINGNALQFELDSGSAVSTLSVQELGRKFQVNIAPSSKRLSNYDGQQIQVVGEVTFPVVYHDTTVNNQTFQVVNNNINLAGRDLMKKLGFSIHHAPPALSACHVVVGGSWGDVSGSSSTPSDTPGRRDAPGGSADASRGNNVKQGNLDVCSGKGILRNYVTDINSPIVDFEANIVLKSDAIPKYHKARSVPFHYKEKIESAINEMVDSGIIEPIKYGNWAFPIVPVIKDNNKVRICVDFKYLNTQINADQFPLPKIDDILASLGSCKFISKLDLKNAYLQIAVNKKSQDYLVMNTHLGLFKFKRLPFGLASAPAIFQRFMTELFKGIDGVLCYLDDIIIVGETKEQHDKRLKSVLQRLKRRNVLLNKAKCLFYESEIPYLGFILTREGIKPNPNKIKAIAEVPKPHDVQSLRSFLGMCVHYSRFVKDCSSILTPLYNLTQDNVKFEWCGIHDQAFKTIKSKLINAQILDTYKPESTLILEADASSVGVGAVLKQDLNGKISTIAFASKKLNATESKYSQVDKEAFSIIFGVKKFNDLLVGKKFIIKTDHKALTYLFNPKKGIPSHTNARLQRWALLLSSFNFDIFHISGKSNIVADALSRLPIDDYEDSNIPGEFVNAVHMFNESLISYENIVESTMKDENLQVLKEYIINGFPSKENINENLLPYLKVQDELSLYENVILCKNRMVIPEMLRKTILGLLHDGHKGIVAMKCEARKLVYWPGIDRDIEHLTSSCSDCNVNFKPKNVVPCHWPESTCPWDRVHVDFCGPIDHVHFLVIIDSYTKFIDVHYVKVINSENTIQCLQKCFSNFGIPNTIVSDNATCFKSQEFQDFLKKHHIVHRTGAPYNPSNNGLAERAVQVFKRNYVKITDVGSIDNKLCKLLYSYRRSVQTVTNKTPAELMFCRNFKGPLDIVPKPNNEGERKESHELSQTFKIGDAVYCKNYGKGADWVEGEISEVLGKRNYKVKVNSFGNLYWYRHLSQIFKRNCLHTSPQSLNSEFLNNSSDKSSICRDFPLSSKTATSDVNVQNNHNNCKLQLGSSREGEESSCLRRSSRVIKKPVKLNL